jgi:hypothetical protein
MYNYNMNIIFDQQLAKQLSEKYTVLELDTVMQPGLKEPITLYAVIEINNISQLATLGFFKDMHIDMIQAYKRGEWLRATELANGLLTQFNGELDEFYNLVLDFCQESVKVNRTWDGIKHTVPKE